MLLERRVLPSRFGTATREFTSVIENRGKWYVAYVEETPGVNT